MPGENTQLVESINDLTDKVDNLSIEVVRIRGDFQLAVSELNGDLRKDIEVLSKQVKDLIGNGRVGLIDKMQEDNKNEREKIWKQLRKQSTFRTRMTAVWGVLLVEGTILAFLVKLYVDILPYIRK